MESADKKAVNRKPRPLRIDLIVAVLVKLVALVLIWWFFVRGVAVDINAELMASHLAMPAMSKGVAK